LLVSPYQKHDELKSLCEKLSQKYSIEFLYRDFRTGFREGQKMARDLELYMQKYCGCIFSEEERFLCHSKKKTTPATTSGKTTNGNN